MIILRNRLYSSITIESEEDIKTHLGQEWESDFGDMHKYGDWLRENSKPVTSINDVFVYDLTGHRANLTYLSEVMKNIKCSIWPAYIIVKDSQGKDRVYFIIGLGENGPGKFTEDDLMDAKSIYELMIERGAEDISFTHAWRDLADDVTDWVTTFILKDEDERD